MTNTEITRLLIHRGFTERNARLVASEINQLHPSLIPLWERWAKNASVCDDFSVEGYSIKSLMEKQRMTYPAALLTIDWLLKEPEKAKTSLRRHH